MKLAFLYRLTPSSENITSLAIDFTETEFVTSSWVFFEYSLRVLETVKIRHFYAGSCTKTSPGKKVTPYEMFNVLFSHFGSAIIGNKPID